MSLMRRRMGIVDSLNIAQIKEFNVYMKKPLEIIKGAVNLMIKPTIRMQDQVGRK